MNIEIVPTRTKKYRVKWGNVISLLLVIGIAICVPMYYQHSQSQDNKILEMEQELEKETLMAKARILELLSSNEASKEDIEELQRVIALNNFVQSLQKEFRVSGMYFDPSIIKSVIRKTKGSRYSLDLIMALIYKESKFRATTRSRVAYGLMQIYYWVWKKTYDIPNKQALYDVEYNLDIGFSILDTYHDQTNGDLKQTLFLYNNGGSGKYQNKRYARSILNNLKPRFKKIIDSHGGEDILYETILEDIDVKATK